LNWSGVKEIIGASGAMFIACVLCGRGVEVEAVAMAMAVSCGGGIVAIAVSDFSSLFSFNAV